MARAIREAAGMGARIGVATHAFAMERSGAFALQNCDAQIFVAGHGNGRTGRHTAGARLRTWIRFAPCSGTLENPAEVEALRLREPGANATRADSRNGGRAIQAARATDRRGACRSVALVASVAINLSSFGTSTVAHAASAAGCARAQEGSRVVGAFGLRRYRAGTPGCYAGAGRLGARIG